MDNVYKRLVVLAIYNRFGKIQDYIYDLAEKNKIICETQIIVISGAVDCEDKNKLQKIGDIIIERENKGYDAGAFKEIIQRLSNKNILNKYQELILMNDTFYGPITSWEKVMNEMYQLDIDYWGLIKNVKYIINNKEYKEHIQSFFIAFRNSIFMNKSFIDFWEKMKYADSYLDAVRNYELAINEYLLRKGFNGVAFSELHGGEKYTKDGIVSFIPYCYEFLKECGVPIIKRKALLSIDYAFKIPLIFDYIVQSTTYDIKLIIDDWKKETIKVDNRKFLIGDLYNFCNNYSKIYIWGCGHYGQCFFNIVKALGFNEVDYVVTESSEGKVAKVFDEDLISEQDGIIIGVGANLYDEIYNYAIQRLDKNIVFSDFSWE